MSLELAKLLNEIFRTLVTAAVAIALFFLVQHPGSILNKEATEEQIRREQAKLLIETYSIESPDRRSAALEILQRVYGDGDPLIAVVTRISQIEAEAASIATSPIGQSNNDAQCEALRDRLSALRDLLDEQRTLVQTSDVATQEAVERSIRQTQTQLNIVQDAIFAACR